MNRRHAGKKFVAGGVYNPQQQNTQWQQNDVVTPTATNQPPSTQKQQQPQQVEKAQPETSAQCKIEKEVKMDTSSISATEKNQGDVDEPIGEDSKPKFKKIFLTRKKSSVRLKEKKIRQNRQLRKALLPKNALMALNEVKGIIIGGFSINSNVSGGFTAVVTVNDKEYEGKGSTKVAAKNHACERALRDYVIAKMRQKPRLPKNQAGSTDAMDTTESDDVEPNESSNATCNEEADDVPMINLASFAIYKLFTEWENDGFVIPEFHPPTTQPKNAIETDSAAPKESKRHELPPNWEAIHPATLLCMMRPGISYTSIDPIGERPNILLRVSVKVDGQEYIGKGRSKKSARRNAAVDICNALFNTNFEQEVAE